MQFLFKILYRHQDKYRLSCYSGKDYWTFWTLCTLGKHAGVCLHALNYNIRLSLL